MVHVWVPIGVFDPELKRAVRVDGLVDTGATLTVIPKKLAVELGIEPVGETVVETGAGGIALERGRVWVEIEGRKEIVPVLISAVIDKVLIGVTTLEVLGLQVDPLTGKLKEWTLLLY